MPQQNISVKGLYAVQNHLDPMRESIDKGLFTVGMYSIYCKDVLPAAQQTYL